MSTHKLLTIFLLIGTLIACVSKNQKNENCSLDLDDSAQYSKRENLVLNRLRSLNLLLLNDTAKWWLYNLYYDDTVPGNANSNKPIYLSCLALKPVAFDFSTDSSTVNIVYQFFLNDTTRLDGVSTKYGIISNGVSFNVRDRKFAGFMAGHASHFYITSPSVKFDNISGSEQLTFLRRNRNCINCWYLDAIKKHGIDL
jgi:hypothetical protein